MVLTHLTSNECSDKRTASQEQMLYNCSAIKLNNGCMNCAIKMKFRLCTLTFQIQRYELSQSFEIDVNGDVVKNLANSRQL